MGEDDDRSLAAWWRRATPARRLRVVILPPLLLAVVAMGAWHAADAANRGMPVAPVVVGIALVLVVLYGILALARRPVPGLTPSEAMALRSRQIVRWAVPLAVALAVLGAIVRAVWAP